MLGVHEQYRARGPQGAAGRQHDRHRPCLPGRGMPSLEGHVHYRNVDVSIVKELARRWYPRVVLRTPRPRRGNHRALADIQRVDRGAALLPRRDVRPAARARLGDRPRDRRAAPGAPTPGAPRPSRHRGRGRGVHGPPRNDFGARGGRPLHLSLRSERSAEPLAYGVVGVAQLVELLVVVQVAAGSSPVTHPTSMSPGQRPGLSGVSGCPRRTSTAGRWPTPSRPARRRTLPAAVGSENSPPPGTDQAAATLVNPTWWTDGWVVATRSPARPTPAVVVSKRTVHRSRTWLRCSFPAALGQASTASVDSAAPGPGRRLTGRVPGRTSCPCRYPSGADHHHRTDAPRRVRGRARSG